MAATPGFNKAIAIKDEETGWCAELYPVVAWRIYNDGVESLAAGLEGNISNPMATVLSDGRVEDAGEIHQGRKNRGGKQTKASVCEYLSPCCSGGGTSG